MKTVKHLWEYVFSFENMLLAAKKAQKGKRFQPDVANFHFRLEENLLALQEELRTQTYKPGSYRAFYICDPKKRLISAAPYRDRVVHHALCNIIEPIFERGFIGDSYANRKCKGTHAAIERYQHFARRYRYVLKCDIRKFFPSIDHAILKQEIRRRISCRATLWLCDLILDNSNLQEEHIEYFPGDDLFTPHTRRRGLPIGNLTSQFWANVYFDRFDHFVCENIKAPGYIRYVDDFVLFSNDKKQLAQWREAIVERLAALRLSPHPDKTHIHCTKAGVPFLGYRVFPCYRYMLKIKTHRYRRYLRSMLELRRRKQLSPQTLENRLNSWLGHLRFGQNKRLEQSIFQDLWCEGVNLHRHPRGSWRVLEQQY